MRKTCTIITLTLGLLFSLVLACQAAGTPDQAKALVEKAIKFYNEAGKDKAFAEFNNPKGKFVEGDLYIFVFDTKCKIISHGNNLKLIGKDMCDVRDPDGKIFAKDFMKVGPEGGWVDYKWTNPETKKIQDKTSYLKRVGDVLIGCGAYK